MKDKLKPCPFCGGEVKLIKYTIMNFFFHEDAYYIKCDKCEAQIGWNGKRFKKNKLIESWNRRNEEL